MWYRDATKFASALDEHGSLNRLASATGTNRAVIQDWAKRHADAKSGVIPWGMGRAQLVRPATREPWERVAWISDVHHPYEDRPVWESALDVIRSFQPHRVILGGDWNDLHVISRFNTSSERLDCLQDEIDGGNDLRREVRDAAPDAVLDELEGNHDSRLVSYVQQNAKPLHTLRALRPENLFRHRDFDIHWHPGCGFLLRPFFLAKHGSVVRGEAGASAKAELAAAGISGISGHTHRLATYTRSGYVARSWTEGGCLCRVDPDYVKGGVPNWRQGMVLAEFSTRTDAFNVQEVPAVDGAMRVLGAVAA